MAHAIKTSFVVIDDVVAQDEEDGNCSQVVLQIEDAFAYQADRLDNIMEGYLNSSRSSCSFTSAKKLVCFLFVYKI